MKTALTLPQLLGVGLWLAVAAAKLHSAETLTPEQTAALRKVKTVQLLVIEDYGEAKGLKIPALRTMMQSLIEAGGLRVVGPEGAGDAVLDVKIQGTPRTKKDDAGETRYPFATVDSTVELRLGDVRVIRTIRAIQNNQLQSDAEDRYRKPQDAPFREAFEPRLLAKFPPLLAEWFGVDQARIVGSVLAGKDSQLKVLAVIALGKLGESAVGPLTTALRDPDERVRTFAVDALEKTKSAKAAAVLITAFKDADVAVHCRAIEACGRLKSAAGLEAILEEFKSDTTAVRAAAVWGLSPYEDPRALAALVRAMEDPEPFVRLRASGAMAGKGAVAVGPLTQLLASKSVDVRLAAVEALAGMKDKSRIEPLIVALLDADENVVKQANEGLTRYDPKPSPKPLAPLLKVLTNGSVLARKCAANLLPDCEDPGAVEPLLKVLKGEPADLRPYAANAFTRQKDPRTVEPLLAVLNDKDALLRSQAALALGSQEDARGVEPLVARLKDDNEEVRKSALLALGKIRDRRALKPVLAFLKVEQVELRAQAVWSAGMIGGSESLEPLLGALRDESDFVRRAVPVALGLTGEKKAYEPLIALLNDKDVVVVDESVQGLGYLQDPRAIRPLLTDALHKKIPATDGAMAGSIRGALRQICGDALEPLLAMIKDKEAAIRAHAVWAINSLGGEEQLDLLLGCAQDAAPEVRLEVAEILAFKQGTRDFAVLLELLKDTDVRVRAQAAWSLGERKNPQGVDALIRAMQDPEPRVRGRAAEALGKIKDPRAIPHLVAAQQDSGSDVLYSVKGALRALDQEDQIDEQ